MNYSLYEEYSHVFEDKIFNKEELDIIQKVFNILSGGVFDNMVLKKHMDRTLYNKQFDFNINNNSISYSENLVYFNYCSDGCNQGCLNIIKDYNIYCISVIDNSLKIYHYDDKAFQYFNERYFINLSSDICLSFIKIGILPDNKYTNCDINSSVLKHFKIFELILDNPKNICDKLFNGSSIEDLLLDKKNSVKKKRKFRR